MLLAVSAGCRTETDKLIAHVPRDDCAGVRETAELFDHLHPAAKAAVEGGRVRIALARPAVRADRTLLFDPAARTLTIGDRALPFCDQEPGHSPLLSFLLYRFLWEQAGRPAEGLGAAAPPFAWTCMEDRGSEDPDSPCFLESWIRGHVAMLEAGLDEAAWRKFGERQKGLIEEIGRLQGGEADVKRLALLMLDWHSRASALIFRHIPKPAFFNAVAHCAQDKVDMKRLRTYETCLLLDRVDRDGERFGAGQTRMVLQWLFTDGAPILQDAFAKFGEEALTREATTVDGPPPGN